MATKTATYRVDDEQTTNGGKETIDYSIPYIAHIRVQGECPIIMHRYDADSVEEKGKAAKGSKGKKTDDIESYLYKDDDDYIGVEGTALRAAIVNAGRYMQDPRSSRKSAMDLCKAGIVSLTTLARFEPNVKEPEYWDRRRVVVQRSAVTRVRPAMREGWKASFDLLITTPEYITETVLQKLLRDAGRLCGLYEYRPTYGRFCVVGFDTDSPD